MAETARPADISADIPAETLLSAVRERLPEETADFGWAIHKPQVGDHLLITCEPSDFWKAMPGQAVRTAIAQHIRSWADLLAPTLGVVEWGREDLIEVLIVAADQATADLEAKVAIAHLSGLNPPAASATPDLPECGCPEHGWHLITCVHDGQPSSEERAA